MIRFTVRWYQKPRVNPLSPGISEALRPLPRSQRCIRSIEAKPGRKILKIQHDPAILGSQDPRAQGLSDISMLCLNGSFGLWLRVARHFGWRFLSILRFYSLDSAVRLWNCQGRGLGWPCSKGRTPWFLGTSIWETHNNGDESNNLWYSYLWI